MAGPSRMIIPKNPMACPCSSGGNDSRMIAWAVGASTPPPSPCSTRNAMSWPNVREKPHNTEATVNTATATRYIRFRPTTDATHAVRGMMITSVIR